MNPPDQPHWPQNDALDRDAAKAVCASQEPDPLAKTILQELELQGFIPDTIAFAERQTLGHSSVVATLNSLCSAGFVVVSPAVSLSERGREAARLGCPAVRLWASVPPEGAPIEALDWELYKQGCSYAFKSKWLEPPKGSGFIRRLATGVVDPYQPRLVELEAGRPLTPKERRVFLWRRFVECHPEALYVEKGPEWG